MDFFTGRITVDNLNLYDREILQEDHVPAMRRDV